MMCVQIYKSKAIREMERTEKQKEINGWGGGIMNSVYQGNNHL